jgi:hypothetical protein
VQGWRGSAALLLVLGFAAHAQTAGWSSFESAFPVLPCQDGWAACMTHGQHVDPELRRDTAGRAVPSDARIGWFDLQATAAFSPFTGLSVYEVGGDAVAAADPVPVEDGGDAVADIGDIGEIEPPPAAPAPVPRQADDAAQRQREAEAARRAADAERAAQRQRDADAAAQRQRDAEAAAAQRKRDAEAAAAVAARQQDADAAAAQRQREADAAAQRKREAEAAKAAQMEQDRLEKERAALEAKRLADERAAALKEEEERKAREAANAAPSVDGCQDTNQLEPYAAMGKLSETLIGCLESRVLNDPKPTDKRKASQLLMADAWARSDKKGWETLVKRHLDDIDRSDPDLCFKYALYLSQQGVGRSSGVIRWSNVALENRMVWIGDVYTSRVYSLYKVRAAASQALWQQAEEEHRNAGTDDTREKVEKYRNLTKVNSREWYEYARDSGKDSTIALQLCMSAAGTADYCEAG